MRVDIIAQFFRKIILPQQVVDMDDKIIKAEKKLEKTLADAGAVAINDFVDNINNNGAHNG